MQLQKIILRLDEQLKDQWFQPPGVDNLGFKAGFHSDVHRALKWYLYQQLGPVDEKDDQAKQMHWSHESQLGWKGVVLEEDEIHIIAAKTLVLNCAKMWWLGDYVKMTRLEGGSEQEW